MAPLKLGNNKFLVKINIFAVCKDHEKLFLILLIGEKIVPQKKKPKISGNSPVSYDKTLRVKMQLVIFGLVVIHTYIISEIIR